MNNFNMFPATPAGLQRAADVLDEVLQGGLLVLVLHLDLHAEGKALGTIYQAPDVLHQSVRVERDVAEIVRPTTLILRVVLVECLLGALAHGQCGHARLQHDVVADVLDGVRSGIQVVAVERVADLQQAAAWDVVSFLK